LVSDATHAQSVLSFTLAVFLLIVTPGPGVLSTAGVGAAYGFRFGLRYVSGLFIGTNLVALAVISIHLGWLYAGVALRRMQLGERVQRRINYAMAAAMLGVVALAIAAAA
jgi:threonine/homoserine/homoserine lactone efflux protein